MSARTLREEERRAYADGEVQRAALLRSIIDAERSQDLFYDGLGHPEYTFFKLVEPYDHRDPDQPPTGVFRTAPTPRYGL